MNRNVIFALFALMLGAGAAAKAQDEVKISSIQYQPSQQASFNETFRKCVNDKACTLQARLQLMDDLYVQMGGDMRQINKECALAGYKDCINSQQKAVQDWHRAEIQMVDLMWVIEGKPGNLVAADASHKASSTK